MYVNHVIFDLINPGFKNPYGDQSGGIIGVDTDYVIRSNSLAIQDNMIGFVVLDSQRLNLSKVILHTCF